MGLAGGRVFQTNAIRASYRSSNVLRTLLVLALTAGSVFAQAPPTVKTVKLEKTRKVVHKVEPVYPQDLKRLGIGGIVKLDLQISAKGTVDKVAIVGGNPILADAASRAVKQWQYEPADASSSMILNVEFHPQN